MSHRSKTVLSLLTLSMLLASCGAGPAASGKLVIKSLNSAKIERASAEPEMVTVLPIEEALGDGAITLDFRLPDVRGYHVAASSRDIAKLTLTLKSRSFLFARPVATAELTRAQISAGQSTLRFDKLKPTVYAIEVLALDAAGTVIGRAGGNALVQSGRTTNFATKLVIGSAASATPAPGTVGGDLNIRVDVVDDTTPAPTPVPTQPPTSSLPHGVPGAWNTLFQDNFDGTSLDASKWSDHEPWEKNGYRNSDGYHPVPHTARQLQVTGGKLIMKARRDASMPSGAPFTTAHINTREKFSIPAGVTSYTEARIKAPSGNGLLPAFWLLGNGTNGTGEGWPINGEIDILEFANNKGEFGSPYASLWYPKDVYTNPPGTFLNATHVSHKDSYPKRPELLNSYHTWGLYRSPQKMEIYIDGKLLCTWLPNNAYNGNIPLPPMLFTKAQHIRFSLGVGGNWAGAGYTKDQFQEGDMEVDYVRVWQADENKEGGENAKA